MRRLCTVPGCTKPHRSKGFCNAHYQRMAQRPASRFRCNIPTCNNDQYAKGFCHNHYCQHRLKDPKKKWYVCIVEGCGTKTPRKLYCSKHQQRMDTNGTPERNNVVNDGPCKVNGCDRTAVVKHMCKKHYNREYKQPDTERIK